MQVVLEEQACTEYILQTILNKSSLKLKEQRLQKRLPNLHGRALVLDCLCTDEKGLLYNIEVQNSSAGAIPKRARYHAALMDTHTLKKGEKFSKLPESYVIFITDKDVFPSLTVAKESRAHKRRNYAIYGLLFSCAPSGARF